MEFRINLERSLPGLCYHSVGNQVNFSQHIHHVSTSNFYNQLESLKKEGFAFLGVQEFLNEKRKQTTHKILTVTFDDGYKNNLLCATPVLEALEIPFTVFICSKILGGELFWRDKVRILFEKSLIPEFEKWAKSKSPDFYNQVDFHDFYFSSKRPPVNSKVVEKNIDHFFSEHNISTKHQGLYLSESDLKKFPSKWVCFGNHTQNHYKLSTLSKEEQAEEIYLCNKELNRLSVPVSEVFAIPFGEIGSFNQDTLQLIHDYRFSGFLMTNQNQFGQPYPKVPFNSYELTYSNRILPENKLYEFL